MYISQRSAFVRNCAVASVNGTITLVILLIAPLGLLAVIVNTLLVTLSTFIIWLWRDGLPNGSSRTHGLTYRQSNREIERRRDD
jgi:hypothetical protein